MGSFPTHTEPPRFRPANGSGRHGELWPALAQRRQGLPRRLADQPHEVLRHVLHAVVLVQQRQVRRGFVGRWVPPPAGRPPVGRLGVDNPKNQKWLLAICDNFYAKKSRFDRVLLVQPSFARIIKKTLFPFDTPPLSV